MAKYDIQIPYTELNKHLLGQSGNVMLEQFFRLLPDTSVGTVLELQKTGEESLAKLLGTLARNQRRQMVNTDHSQRQVRVAKRHIDRHRWLFKDRGDVVNRNRVIGIGPAKTISTINQASGDDPM